MFKSGDYVYIKESAQLDINGLAWNYVQNHRDAQIICQHGYTPSGLHESEYLYVVFWPEPFEGGWDCWHKCLPGYGQIVTAKNMELKFEASTENVVTVPNIELPPDRTRS